MGNKHSDHSYSFSDKYNILASGPSASGLYKLQDRSTMQPFIGRELSCNDDNEAYQLECIIHEKINNPSPFVTKLLNYELQRSQSYCSNSTKFYLLYKDFPRLLSDEIAARQSSGRHFQLQQIDAVLTRVCKGIKYLYDIYHHHGAISYHSITWPANPNNNSNESIQLVDEWAFNIDNRENKYKNLRPKDQQDIQQKNIQKSHDLYSLGYVAKEMLNTANGVNILKSNANYNLLLNKIIVLTSQQSQDRFLIFNMINNQYSFDTLQKNDEMFKANSYDNLNMNNMSNMKVTQNQFYQNPLHSLTNFNSIPNQYNLFSSNSANYNNSYSKQSFVQQSTAQPVRQSFSQPRYTNYNIQPAKINSIQPPKINFSIPTRPVSQPSSTYQANMITPSVQQQTKIQGPSYKNASNININMNQNRSASVGKVTFNSGGATSHTFNRNASAGKITINNQQQPSFANYGIKSNLSNVKSSTNFNFTIPANQQKQIQIKSNVPKVNFSQNYSSNKNLIVQPSPIIQFNSNISALNPVTVPTVPTSNISFNPSPLQLSPSLPQLNLQSNIVNDFSQIQLHSFNVSNNKNPSPVSIANKSIPNNSSLSGFNYSFGQSSSSDKTFSFKNSSLPAHSISDDNLYTSSDFFKKLNQPAVSISEETSKQTNQISPSQAPLISSITSPLTNLTAANIPVTTSFANSASSFQYSSSLGSVQRDFHFNPQIKTENTKQNLLKNIVIPNNFPQFNLDNINNLNIISKADNKLPTSPATITTGATATEHTNFNSKIDDYKAIHDEFDKIASSHTNIQTPNIVINEINRNISQNHKQDHDIYDKYYQEAKNTPIKNENKKQNQPFSTIPQVSERSASARSDEERDYVIEQYENGSRYQGFKSNGMRNGKGKFYYQEGSFYDGEWKNNNMHGYGKLYYSNQKLAYEGEWFIDQFHGRGKVYNDEPAPIFGFFDYTNFDNLDEKWKYYEGDLVCDAKQGDGKLVLSNQQYYEGQFKNDKVDGKGKFVTKNGEVISGIWQDSRLVKKF